MGGPIDIAAVREAHAKFERAHAAVVTAALEASGEIAKHHVAHASAFKRRSADSLKDATETAVIRTRTRHLLRVKSRKPYAAYVEFGTRAHMIHARRARALAFHTGGRLVFARSVRHPGTPAFHFLRHATDTAFVHAGLGLRAGMARIASQF